jgi:hypothetical protein
MVWTCLLFGALFSLADSANAQLQQPFVYTTGGAIATRDYATGVLAPTSVSPLAVLGAPAVLDAKGRFLFAAGNNSIHMYQVDFCHRVLHRSPRLAFRFPEHQ